MTIKYITINKGPLLYRGKEFNVIEPPKHYDGVAIVRGWSLDSINIQYRLLYYMAYGQFPKEHGCPPWTQAIRGRGDKYLNVPRGHRRRSPTNPHPIF